MKRKTLSIVFIGLIYANCHSVNGQDDLRNVFLNFEVTTSAFTYGDLDGDNLEEIVVAFEDEDFLSITPNHGDKMGTPLQLPIGLKVTIKDVLILDINDDNLNDIVFVDNPNNRIGVLINLGDLSFDEVIFFETGAAPVKIAAADLDNNGFVDLVSVNSGSNSLSIFYYDDVNVFSTAEEISTGQLPVDIEIKDLNEDGFEDFIVANQNSSNIGFHYGSAEGYSSAVLQTGELMPTNVEIKDIDADANHDLVVIFESSNLVHIYFGNPDGTYDIPIALEASYESEPIDFIIEDTDSDGINDIILGSKNGMLSQFIGNGDKTFDYYADNFNWEGVFQFIELAYTDILQSGTKGFLGTNPNTIRVFENYANENYELNSYLEIVCWFDMVEADFGDLNNDGNIDIVMASQQFEFITIYSGLGNDKFEFKANLTSGQNTNSVKIIDLDLDGHLDIVCGGYRPTIFLNDGSGNYTENILSSVIGNSYVLADYNNDDYPDLVFWGSLYLNDQSGGFTFSETFGFNIEDMTALDFNGDQNIDLAITYPYDDKVEVYPGLGDGSFGTKITIAYQAFTIDTYDANGDGLDDLILGNNFVTQNGSILLSSETDPFSVESASFSLPTADYAVLKILDVTRDNIPEIVLLGPGVVYYPINSNGTLGDLVEIDITGNDFNNAFLSDYNSDEQHDELVIVHSGWISIDTEKLNAEISLINMEQIYDGSQIDNVVQTSPEVNYEITYNGESIRPSNAGTYTVEVIVIDDTYKGFASGELIVSKAPLTIQVLDVTRYYGAENPEFELTFNGFVGSDESNDIDELPIVSTEATQESLPGQYAITLEGGVDNNYDITLTNGQLTIEKAILDVVAEDVFMREEDALPEEFLYTMSGFVLGEDKSVIDVLPDASIEIENVEIGSYPISVSGGEDDTYSFSYTNGTLTIAEVLGTDLDSFNGLVVFPNPTVDMIHIHTEQVRITGINVLDLQGRLIDRVIDIHEPNREFKLDATGWSPGIYMIWVSREDDSTTIFKVKVNH